MQIIQIIQNKTVEAFQTLFNAAIDPFSVKIEDTSEDFEGHLTLLVFPLARFSKKPPEETARLTGEYLVEKLDFLDKFNVVKGFLNLVINNKYWIDYLNKIISAEKELIEKTTEPQTILVEFSSPNTNKPLHLGHIRNNLIGHSISEILKACGHHVVKVNLLNDRGIHICKSMTGWKNFGHGETPENSGIKGDHLVGKYYVEFEKQYKKQISQLKDSGLSDEDAANQAPLILEARQMLKNWEESDTETRKTWQMMNNWVYSGFEETYQRMGISFDKLYHESETYLLGKKLVQEGLQKSVFFRKKDGSVWVDLHDQKLDEKNLLRADGTSVYITQDIGTAQLRFDEYHQNKTIYVVGNEQDYHFNVLKAVLEKLGKEYAAGIYHLSYGMVDLPEGRMKTREGTVVDADDLMDEMTSTAKSYIESSGKSAELSDSEKNELSEMVGMAALKFFILKTDARKRMVFNPEESIDFQGHTGPFVQYTYARISSIFRKLDEAPKADQKIDDNIHIQSEETDILRKIHQFSQVVRKVENDLDPSAVANFVYSLAKIYNKFYHEYPVIKEENEESRKFRIQMSRVVANVIETAMKMLGIKVPEKM